MLLNNKGSSFLYIIFILVLLSLLSIGLLYITFEDNIISFRNINNTSSYYMADYKLQLVLNSDKYYENIKNNIKDYLKYRILSSRIYIDKDDLLTEEENNLVFIYNDEDDELRFKILSTSKYKESVTKLEALIDPFIFFNTIYEYKILTNIESNEKYDEVLVDEEIINKFTNSLYEKYYNDNLFISSKTIYPGSNVNENLFILGDLSINGNLSLPTTINGLIYVKGNLILSSEVTINGILIVDGQILINSYIGKEPMINGMLVYNSTLADYSFIDYLEISYDVENINMHKVLYNEVVFRDNPKIIKIKKLVN